MRLEVLFSVPKAAKPDLEKRTRGKNKHRGKYFGKMKNGVKIRTAAQKVTEENSGQLVELEEYFSIWARSAEKKMGKENQNVFKPPKKYLQRKKK